MRAFNNINVEQKQSVNCQPQSKQDVAKHFLCRKGFKLSLQIQWLDVVYDRPKGFQTEDYFH